MRTLALIPVQKHSLPQRVRPPCVHYVEQRLVDLLRSEHHGTSKPSQVKKSIFSEIYDAHDQKVKRPPTTGAVLLSEK